MSEALYIDNTTKSLEEWRERLRTSETNKYKFLGERMAYTVTNGVTYLKVYSGGNVATYEMERE